MSNINDNVLGKHILSDRSVENVKLINLTFDLNLTAQQVDFNLRLKMELYKIVYSNVLEKSVGD